MRRELRFELRLESAELELWRAAAARGGVGVSAFVRGRVNGSLAVREPREPPFRGEGDSWWDSFLLGLADGLSVAETCRAAGVSRTLVYRERARSREFAIAWELALEESDDSLAERLHGGPVLPRRPRASTEGAMVAGLPRGAGARRGRLELRVDEAELTAWRAAAATLGVSLSGLVRRVVRGVLADPSARERRGPSWRSLFVAALRDSGFVADACRVAGVSRTLAYRERAASPAFRQAWDAAENAASDRYEFWLWQWGGRGLPVVRRTVKVRADGGVETIVHESRRLSEWALTELLRRRGAE